LAEFERLLKEEPSTTEVERLRKERIGQNVFRSALMDYWDKSCAVTGVQNPTLLRASHIVPWATCESDEERLNVHNGLLLVATLDAAFDAGLITFEDDGRILISGKLSESDQVSSGIGQHMRLSRMNDEVRKRLAWHRDNLFTN
jgi:predicted restriction endonuclease